MVEQHGGWWSRTADGGAARRMVEQNGGWWSFEYFLLLFYMFRVSIKVTKSEPDRPVRLVEPEPGLVSGLITLDNRLKIKPKKRLLADIEKEMKRIYVLLD
ncbi:unnamed protein product [Vicia faba]|uniref:Uncharacterized protein n=1 Tax=Vicia faba TaxID=3906 RepID=A0AAV0Z5V5_VICFA|nr:unnamed protein product [Vicia faba]